ncbi:unnamed protein product, partial [Iphiclides podalirius]
MQLPGDERHVYFSREHQRRRGPARKKPPLWIAFAASDGNPGDALRYPRRTRQLFPAPGTQIKAPPYRHLAPRQIVRTGSGGGIMAREAGFCISPAKGAARYGRRLDPPAPDPRRTRIADNKLAIR